MQSSIERYSHFLVKCGRMMLIPSFCAVCLVVLAVTIDPFAPSSPPRLNNNIGNSDLLYPEPPCAMKNLQEIENMAVVYTWVNGSVPCYQTIRQKHGGKAAVGGGRDREIGELRASVRSLEKFMPWHKGPIYFVSPGHIPNWLNQSHPRVQVINQEDLIPNFFRSYLPTFNTNVLEMFLYRIPGLTDMFMQLNDDFIFTKPVTPYDFFGCNGEIKLLNENNVINPDPPDQKGGNNIWQHSVRLTNSVLTKKFGEKTRWYMKHAPFIMNRRAWERIHEIFGKEIIDSLPHKFRHKFDMNPPLLHFYYLMHRGKEDLGVGLELRPAEENRKNFHLIIMKDDKQERLDELQQFFWKVLANNHDCKVLALNDGYKKPNEVPAIARDFFEKFLPEPSSFELGPGARSSLDSFHDPNTCKIDPSILLPGHIQNKIGVTSRQDQMKRVWIRRRLALLKDFLVLGTGLGMGLGLGLCLVYSLLAPGQTKEK